MTAAGKAECPITVRRASEVDSAAIALIYNQGIEDQGTLETEFRTPEERRRWLTERPERLPVLVAEYQGIVRGWASFNLFNPRHAYRFVADLSIYVQREYRGAGIGSALLREVIDLAPLLGYHKLVLITFPQNTSAIALYEKAGFRTVGDYHEQGLLGGKWTDTRIMELIVTPGYTPPTGP